jgi:glucose-fructose oxidoreductase
MKKISGKSPLHDIGIYCINAARSIFKDEPTEVFAFAVNPDSQPARIHQTVVATLKFPKERIASFTCSFGSSAISNYRVVGTRGDLFIDNAYEYVGEMKQQLTVGEKKKVWTSKPGDQFAAELDYFSNCVLKDREPEPSGAHGLVDVEIIQALLRSIETGKKIPLKKGLPKMARRPTMALKIKKPAHREPRLVKVSQPAK